MSGRDGTLLFGDTQRTDALSRSIPFFTFIGILAVRGALADSPGYFGVFDLRWLYALQAAIAAVALASLSPRYTELACSAKLQTMPFLASVATGIAVLAIWIAPIPAWGQFGAVAATFVAADPDGSLRWDLIAVRTFGAAMVVPVMEELFWRSFLMRWIDRRDFLGLPPGAVSIFAVVTSSAVFALAHSLWLPGLLAGLAYALLYRQTSNLWYPVVAHATTNAMLALWVVTQRAWQFW